MGVWEDILRWGKRRPQWQRDVLNRLVTRFPVDDALVRQTADALVGGARLPELSEWPAVVRGPASRADVRLLEIREPDNVNALLPDESLTFAPEGITVVYGRNGSGKSGYFRLVDSAVGSGGRSDVLGNVFAESGTEPTAELHYSVDGRQHRDLWPRGDFSPLQQVWVYDDDRGRDYVRKDNEPTYRPSDLRILDQLIQVCDGVRDVLQQRRRANRDRAGPMPQVAEGTDIAAFLGRINANTTEDEIDSACALDGDVDAELANLVERELFWGGGETTRLRRSATAFRELADHLDQLEEALGQAVEQRVRSNAKRLADAHSAAEAASSCQFDAEPLPGVGSDMWRALWEAARDFSDSEAYPAATFPRVDEDAHCVLCHQQLAEVSRDRMARFEEFLNTRTQERVRAAEQEGRQLRANVVEFEVVPASVAVHLETAESVDGHLAEKVREVFEAFERRSTGMSELTDGFETTLPGADSNSVVVELRSVANRLAARIHDMDTSRASVELGRVRTRRQEIEGRRAVARQRQQVVDEVARLAELSNIDRALAETDTSPISAKVTKLSKAYATSTIRETFANQVRSLGVERVRLQDRGARKGKVKQKPAFDGAVQRTDVHRVLSEGEQTALGLAGFFTEVVLDESRSPVVLDDPMTSLDHERRARVAARIVELARDRQVVVFTHDASFALDVRNEATRADVTFQERSVQRVAGGAGKCSNEHPWRAKDAKARLTALDARLGRFARESGNWDEDSYDEEVADFAGKLSETWERLVRLDIANELVDPVEMEVRPAKLRLLAKVTEVDVEEFRQSYGRCSRWARRHDKDPELNHVAPSVEELRAELQTAQEWHSRVRKYLM